MSNHQGEALARTDIPALPLRRGKVRDVYDLGSELLLVATDRISAYDVVLPTPIPGKGVLLTKLTRFWLNALRTASPHHLIEVMESQVPSELRAYSSQLQGRTMRCRKTQPVPIECVVRGYLAGSGWHEYQRSRSVGGVPLPEGLTLCGRLPEPIFTPATKAETGHDENISFEQACARAGRDCMVHLRERSLALYTEAAEHARSRGIIIADTKFEFGKSEGAYLLIDEVLTPDSSRFWPARDYAPGRDQESFDKQFVRNYLAGLVERGEWNKTPPAPPLPDDVVAGTARRYREAYEWLTGSAAP